MKLFLLLIGMLSLQSCYLDDVEVRKVRESMTLKVASLNLTEVQAGVVRGVNAGDILRLTISGEVSTPIFSDVYEKYLSCSWREVLLVPHFVDQERIIHIPIGGISTDFGHCLVSIREFLGYDKTSFNFENDLDLFRLKIRGQDEDYDLTEIIERNQEQATFEVVVTDEMITNQSELQLIIEPEYESLVSVGVIEILEEETSKSDVKILDGNYKTQMVSESSTQIFDIEVVYK